VKAPVNVTEPSGIRFALAIVTDARITAVISFSFMVLLTLAPVLTTGIVEVVARFGAKYVLFRTLREHRYKRKFPS
jgi:hypothetical protein